jgi:hypothetical protein
VNPSPKTTWQSSEDGWKDLADMFPAEGSTSQPSPVPELARGWHLQTPAPPPSSPVRPFRELQRLTRSERRLWFAAGSLMVLAAVVLGVLGLLTFEPQRLWSGPLPSVAVASAAAQPSAAPPAVAPAQPLAAPRIEALRPTEIVRPAPVRALAKSPARDKDSHHHGKSKHASHHRSL